MGDFGEKRKVEISESISVLRRLSFNGLMKLKSHLRDEILLFLKEKVWGGGGGGSSAFSPLWRFL